MKLDYAPTSHHDTARLITAARSPTPTKLEQLLSHPLNPNCVQATLFSTTTPLEAATKGRRVENLKLLLEAKINANTNVQIVHMLLQARADMEAPNNNRCRPLALAAWANQPITVLTLLAACCNPLAAERVTRMGFPHRRQRTSS